MMNVVRLITKVSRIGCIAVEKLQKETRIMVPEKKIGSRLPLEIGMIEPYSMGEKLCLETVSSGQVELKRHVE